MKANGINASARLLCGAATFLALAVTGTPVMAQEVEEPAAVEDEGEDIVVTGIRGSIQSSLDAKRNATSIVEVISSEDLGLLPDLSIADSLARLPGVTAQRVRGRSQQVSIRGLGPDFSLALLNGREVVSAGNNRGIEFDQFPSELIGSGVVYKTGDAQLASIGIAGAVDLRTVKPLDSKKRQMTLSGTYTINDNGSLNPDFGADGYRFFGSYIDQNADGTIGWSIGATVQSIPTQIIQRELKTNNGQIARTPAGVIFPRDNPRQGVQSREFKRTSVAGSLQFEPTDTFSLTIDSFYTATDDSGIFRGTETPIASWSTNGGAQVGAVTGSGPFAESATYRNVFPILRTDTQGADSSIFAIGGNMEWKATDNLGFVLDYGYSTLDRDDVNYESYAGTGRNGSGPADTLTFNFNPNGEYTIDGLIDYTNPANVLLTDPGGWGQVGFLRVPETNDELHQLRAEAYWEFDGGFIDRIVAGWLYTDRSKDFDNNGIFLRPGAGFVNSSRAIPSDTIIGSTNTKGIGQDIIAYNPASLLTNGAYTLQAATDDTEWLVDEQVHNFYIQANIDGEVGSVPVRGNIGLRYVDTSQSSTGTISGGRVNEVSANYDNWLPSANLSFEVMEDTFIRVAYAKSITRARLDQLAANQNINVNPLSCSDTNADQIPDTVIGFNPPALVCFNLSGGNPTLQPYRSTSFDISFEKYFSPGTAIIIAAFHKDLSDWVINQPTILDLTQQIENAGFGSILTNAPQLATGAFDGPVNFSDGNITGIEGTVRVNFGDFIDALDGFGGFYSVTYSDAKIDPPGQNPIRIPGYSDLTWSSDIFYEKYGFRAKLAARYRGGFLSEVPNFAGGLEGAEALSETILDAQLGYTFEKEGSVLNGVQVLAEVFNLTDQPFRTQNELFNAGGASLGTSFPSRHEIYGRTFQFTIRKSF
ncbi:iron complex outermembrane receptor protein [Erythromicrobium ramosum]|uniref:Iron complex outermembrane receptor protein n=1 Tax=Erythrobacter ramosus TaxID=35811 RepID=A0A6I4UQ50_9SPHN|nr:TonB-dependent receptor [Erythrobacter ramosus]MBB3777101.1 iron complex outermembrane receptor protein [Erythrobacter ramosus]MXP39759.1 TonB-dependent receptor [Erythrobacter ramosus]